jgi:monofunctional biosynthetic peptidoglycan transglycosylase
LRKAEEAIITVMIETVMSKQRIFEIYLNVIEWGNGVFGAEAAARHYFRKSAASLDAWEAARMAAMVPKPRFYDRKRDTPWLDRKTNLILGRMPLVQVP